MQKWIILKMMHTKEFNPNVELTMLEQIAECDDDGKLMVFNSLDDAYAWKEGDEIDGRCVELPLY